MLNRRFFTGTLVGRFSRTHPFICGPDGGEGRSCSLSPEEAVPSLLTHFSSYGCGRSYLGGPMPLRLVVRRT